MKRRLVFLMVFFALSLALGFYFDAEIVKAVSLWRNFVFDEFFLGITFLSSEIIIFFFLTSLFLWKDNKRRWIAPLWLSLALSALVSFILKILIKRPRPFELDIVSSPEHLISSNFLTWNFSFPSFQAMLAFSAIPILNKEFPKFKYVWIGFAVLVAFSRLYFGVHFLSDILAGAVIGLCIGMLVAGIESKRKFGERIYRKIFGR